MKRPPADLARRLLSATEEILRPGREPRLEDVAALVGSSRATLYYYFSGRDDLLDFLLEEHLAAAADLIDKAAGADQAPTVRLRSVVAALAEFLGRRPGVFAGLLSFAGASGRVGAVRAAKDARLAAPLRRILQDGVAAGEFSIGDPRDAANAILGAAMIATLTRWEDGGDTTQPAFQQALTDQIVRGVAAG